MHSSEQMNEPPAGRRMSWSPMNTSTDPQDVEAGQEGRGRASTVHVTPMLRCWHELGFAGTGRRHVADRVLPAGEGPVGVTVQGHDDALGMDHIDEAIAGDDDEVVVLTARAQHFCAWGFGGAQRLEHVFWAVASGRGGGEFTAGVRGSSSSFSTTSRGAARHSRPVDDAYMPAASMPFVTIWTAISRSLRFSR